jgi:hypothetical protein
MKNDSDRGWIPPWLASRNPSVLSTLCPTRELYEYVRGEDPEEGGTIRRFG